MISKIFWQFLYTWVSINCQLIQIIGPNLRDKVADIMTLKKFQLMRRNLHFNDNLKDDGDRYYKIRPVLQSQASLSCEEESHFSRRNDGST